MQQLICYHKGPIWNAAMLPTNLANDEDKKRNSLATLSVLQGQLELAQLSEQGDIIARYQLNLNQSSPVIQLNQRCLILSASDDISCQLSLYCSPEEYTYRKHGMTKTHSEVIAAVPLIKKAGNVLDLGCGRGRNALYLQQLGFDVTALDKSEQSINHLNAIAKAENLSKFNAVCYDINHASLSGSYDFVLSTVVMMFLDPVRIADIVKNMQSITKKGGYNLIVSAMTTSDYPCAVPFSFTFKKNELRDYYCNWHIEKYNEHVGHLHRTDNEGNRIMLRFATLLAKKDK